MAEAIRASNEPGENGGPLAVEGVASSGKLLAVRDNLLLAAQVLPSASALQWETPPRTLRRRGQPPAGHSGSSS